MGQLSTESETAAREAVSRIPLLSPSEAQARAADVGLTPAFAELNVFRVLLHRPKTAKAVADLLVSQLFGAALDDRLRELVIMRIGWATGCDYEWTQHWRVAQEPFGCTSADLLAVRDWTTASDLDETDRVVMACVDETLERGAIGKENWQRLEKHVTEIDARLELVTAIGTWRMISECARSIEFPLEAGVASWPPDGEASPGAR